MIIASISRKTLARPNLTRSMRACSAKPKSAVGIGILRLYNLDEFIERELRGPARTFLQLLRKRHVRRSSGMDGGEERRKGACRCPLFRFAFNGIIDFQIITWKFSVLSCKMKFRFRGSRRERSRYIAHTYVRGASGEPFYPGYFSRI